MSLPSGYSFKTTLSWIELQARLVQLGHGTWEERESAWYGDYLSGELWGSHMRIFDGQGGGNELGTYDPKGFLLIDYGKRGEPTDEIDRRLREELFPALEVTEWKPDERND
jgi:hypothetical protein